MSIGDLFSKSWKLYKNSFWRLIAVVLIPMAVVVGAGLVFLVLGLIFYTTIFSEFLGSLSRDSSTFSFIETIASVGPLLILGLVFALVMLIVNFWSKASQLVAVRDTRSSVDIKKSLKEGWRLWVPYAWVAVLEGLALMVGFILLIIPGIIFAIWFIFTPYTLMFDGFKGVAALKRSKELVQGYWWAVFGRMALMMLIVFAFSFVPLVGSIGSFLAGIYAIVYFSVLYEDLKRVKG